MLIHQQRFHVWPLLTFMCHVLLPLVIAFNLDTRTPVIKNERSGSYFGFSVALHQSANREKSLLIGAPLADIPPVRHGGAVFRCPIDRPGNCLPLNLDRRGENITNGVPTESRTGQWLGASISTSASGSLMACAPRYVHFSVNFRRREPVGLCYLIKNINAEPFEFSPCKVKEQWGYHRLGSCQAGFASAIARTGDTFYLTAPGSFYWHGQVYSYDMLNKNQLATRESKPENDDTYMGYSITNGKFTTSTKGLDVAVGIPKGNSNLSGKVLILDERLQQHGSLVGESLGSYFGYSLAALDADGDGLMDLAIGAPMYTQPGPPLEFEQGRVYVFYQRPVGLFSRMQPLDGQKSRARFGMALASLGDQLGDGSHSLVVGAPYDGLDRRGCVYVFHGRRGHGLRTQPSQVLTAEQFSFGSTSAPPQLRTFGFALSSGLDLTDDDLFDLVIGSYASDSAVFLRSRPVVHQSLSLKVTPDSISLENRDCIGPNHTRVACVQIEFCLGYNGSRAVPDDLRFRWNVTLDAQKPNNGVRSRMFLLPAAGFGSQIWQHQGVLHVQKSKKSCTNFTAYISEVLRDKLNPIGIALDYEIISQSDSSRSGSPVLNQYVDQQLYKNVTIKKNCGRDNVCIPDLQLQVTSNTDAYVLGANEKLKLNVVVHNKGEDAFETVLKMQMPPDVNLVQIDQSKSHTKFTWQEYRMENTGQSKIDFDLGNPLPADKSVRFVIELSAKDTLTVSKSNYAFRFNLTSSNPEEEKTQSDNQFDLVVPLRVNVTLEPFGQSYVGGLPQALIHNVSSELGFMGKKETYQQIRHAYFLKNKGPSTVREMEITILWPEKSIEGNPLFELISQPRVRITDITNRLTATCQDIFLDVDIPIESRPLEESNPADDPISYHRSLLTNYSLTARYRRSTGETENGQSELTCDDSRCRKIHCTVRDMHENSGVTFEVYARPWNTTLREIGLSQFFVTSIMVARIRQLQYNVDPSFIPPQVIKVTTMINLIGMESISIIPLWIIIVAICFGLLILFLIILCLWKLGFFVRKRPPVSSADREPLHDSNYDYRKPDSKL